MPKTKRTVYLVTDFGGDWDNPWELPYMAFDNEQAAKECAEKRARRNQPDPRKYPESMWDEYVSSTVSAITVLVDEPTEQTCQNIYDESECGACANGFKCSVCGVTVEDCEGYCVHGMWNYCPKCRRKVVKGGH